MALATLSVDLVAKLANFERDMGLAARSAEKNSKQISNALGSIKNTMVGLTAVFAGLNLVDFVKQQIDAADSAGKMAQKVGISVEELSKLQYAAKLADVDSGQLQVGLVKLSKGMVEAANGTGQARNALAAMGIGIKNTDGTLKTSGKVLSDVASKFATYEDGANKTAIAVQLFGKSGADLIPLLNAGANGLKEAGDELERFGGVISTKTAKDAEQFNDNLTRLSTVAAALGKSVANDVMPYLTQLSTEFITARANGLGFMEMLSMGLRSGDYVNQLKEIDKEIKLLEKSKGFFLSVDNSADISSLEKQKKTIIDLQTIMMKDQLAGPPKPADTPTKKAPFSLDLDKMEKEAEKYAKGLGRAQDANDKFIASMREMGQKAQLEMDAAFMTEPQRKFVQDMISVNKSFLDTQADVTKQYTEGKLKLSDYNEQAAILSGNYQFAAEQAQKLKDQQEALNNSWEYGASKALNSYANDVMNISKQVEGAFGRVAKGMEDSIVNFAMTGKASFSDLANSMIADMVRIMVQQSITAPLAKAGASFFGSMFGGPLNSTSVAMGQGGGSFSSPAFQLPSFDGGGYTGSGTRSGGVDGIGGFMAVLHPNETVIDHSKKNIGGGGSVNINIINQGAQDGYKATATVKKNDSGFDIGILISKAFNEDIARNGPMSQNLSSAFGLRRGAM